MTDYYISNTGNDNATGTSPTTAWATLAKLQTITLQPGDVVRLEKGGEWREQLYSDAKGAVDKAIKYDCYGSGARPLVNGADLFDDNWVSELGIWCQTVAYVGDVVFDGDFQLRVPTAVQVGTTPNSYHWDPVTGKLCVSEDPITGLYENAVRTPVIFYDRVRNVRHNNIDARNADRVGLSGPDAGYGILAWQSENFIGTNATATNTQRHAIGDSGSIGCVFWENVVGTGTVGNKQDGQYSVNGGPEFTTAFVSFSVRSDGVADTQWCNAHAEASYRGVDGRDHNTFIAHGGSIPNLRLFDIRGVGSINLSDQSTTGPSNWYGANLASERLVVKDGVKLCGVAISSVDDPRITINGDSNTIDNLTFAFTGSGSSTGGVVNLTNNGANNLLNGVVPVTGNDIPENNNISCTTGLTAQCDDRTITSLSTTISVEAQSVVSTPKMTITQLPAKGLIEDNCGGEIQVGDCFYLKSGSMSFRYKLPAVQVGTDSMTVRFSDCVSNDVDCTINLVCQNGLPNAAYTDIRCL